MESEDALPLVFEAVLLVVFGVTGSVFAGGRVLSTVLLLCFTMGLQNAIVTKLSNAVIRTTYLTGMVTDIGIALGRVVSSNQQRVKGGDMDSEIDKVLLLFSLIAMFFIGGVTGALGFRHVGFFFTLPLAAIVLLMAVMPLWDDLHRSSRKADA